MKPSKRFTISGTGFALVESHYSPIDLSNSEIHKYLSIVPGDGGLEPGKVILASDFKAFSGEAYLDVRPRITHNSLPLAINAGGSSVVSMIHASQILHKHPVDVNFYGSGGNDENGDFLQEKLSRTPINVKLTRESLRPTPFTDILSDPSFNDGHPEKVAIHELGSAWDMVQEDLEDQFFKSDIAVFGGTALVPNIHTKLIFLLAKARKEGAFTVVNTIFDFISEKEDPNHPWAMGNSIDTYNYIDLLLADMEEALRLSGAESPEEAMGFFKMAGVKAVIITDGENPVHFYSKHPQLGIHPVSKLPVSEKVKVKMGSETVSNSDTIGCGDNFAGGVIASIAEQMIANEGGEIDFLKAIALGVASGGFACFYQGGIFYESSPGQKATEIKEYMEDYLKQIGK